jgi:hypothetical protein
MKNSLVTFSLLACQILFNGSALNAQRLNDTSVKRPTGDSVRVSIDIHPGDERNITRILDFQKEQQRKQGQKAISYIAIGVAMLGVFIYGMSRKVKRKR